MKIGDRGQVTIPKRLRERFGMGPRTEVDFVELEGELVLRKRGKRLNLKKWAGLVRKSFEELGYKTVDEYIEDVRGR
jgi:AbrB family looped-hinge helix DNA binding protein